MTVRSRTPLRGLLAGGRPFRRRSASGPSSPDRPAARRLATSGTGEAYLVYRCLDCGAVGDLTAFPDGCLACGAGRESLYYELED